MRCRHSPGWQKVSFDRHPIPAFSSHSLLRSCPSSSLVRSSSTPWPYVGPQTCLLWALRHGVLGGHLAPSPPASSAIYIITEHVRCIDAPRLQRSRVLAEKTLACVVVSLALAPVSRGGAQRLEGDRVGSPLLPPSPAHTASFTCPSARVFTPAPFCSAPPVPYFTAVAVSGARPSSRLVRAFCASAPSDKARGLRSTHAREFLALRTFVLLSCLLLLPRSSPGCEPWRIVRRVGLFSLAFSCPASLGLRCFPRLPPPFSHGAACS